MFGQEILLTIWNSRIAYLDQLIQKKIVIKHVYSGYGITFDSGGSWSFDHDFARNVIIVGVDNSSSSHSDNCNNKFLITDQVSTYGINGSFGSLEKKFSLILVKQTQNFAWACIMMLMIVICLLMEKKYLSLKSTIKMLTFLHNFVLEVYLMDLVLLGLEKYL